MMRWVPAAVAALALGMGAPVQAQQVGVPITVEVTDTDGKPIPTATVRNPQEAERRAVNAFDGRITFSVLYLPDGSEVILERGMHLDLEISAPGYVNDRVRYTIRRRRNVIPVTLEKMELDIDDLDIEDPVIQFGRDRPIDGRSGDPAH